MGALVFLGVLPVYYKMFAMVRGEPFVAFFCVIAVYYAARVFVRDGAPVPDALLMGGALGVGRVQSPMGYSGDSGGAGVWGAAMASLCGGVIVG